MARFPDADQNLFIRCCDAVTPDGIRVAVDINIVDGVIASVEPAGSTEVPAATPEIDGSGLLAVPGFINTHTHAAMSLLRGAVEDVPVESWFNDYVWPIEVNINPDDVELGTALACAEMIAAGITTFVDHYFFETRAAAAVEQSGIRANLGHTFFSSQGTEGLNASIDFARTWNGRADGRITTSIAPHATYTCSDEHLAAAADAARDLDIRLHLHAAEHLEQTESSLAQRGITPIQVLEQTGILDAGAIIAHGCGIVDTDLPILARHADRVGVAHCPKVYLKHGLDPLTPIRQLHANNITVALGTDGPAGCNSIDVMESMRLTAMTQKHAERDATWMTTSQALEMATVAGATVLGQPSLGALAVGKSADIVLVDLKGLHCQPVHDQLAALVYAASARDVRTTIVDGRVLMLDRQLTTIDAAALVDAVNDRAPQLLDTDPTKSIQTYDP